MKHSQILVYICYKISDVTPVTLINFLQWYFLQNESKFTKQRKFSILFKV